MNMGRSYGEDITHCKEVCVKRKMGEDKGSFELVHSIFEDVEPLINCKLIVFDGNCPNGHFSHKEVLSKRGSMVYILRTYPCMVLYLKGLHLSIDSWRPLMDKDGWRMTNTYEPILEAKLELINTPLYIKIVQKIVAKYCMSVLFFSTTVVDVIR